MDHQLEADRKCPTTVVNITNPVYQSLKGRYFLGQTKPLAFGNGYNAWAGLMNPDDSGVNLYVSTFTVSNFASQSVLALVWLNGAVPGPYTVSKKVTPANTAIVPLPSPRVILQCGEMVTGWPVGGVNPFDQIVDPHSTLVDNKEGKIIIPPGGSFIVYLRASCNDPAKAKVAFGWWEDC